MSSKKFVYLLMMVAIVCGLTLAGTAHGQTKDHINFQGTVTKSDGTSTAGLVIKGVRVDHAAESEFLVVEDTVQADGSYKFSFVAFPFPPTPSPNISAGERIEITVTEGGNVVHSEIYIVTAADLSVPAPLVTLDITLADISVKANPSALEADGVMTSTITVEIGGTARTGDTVTIDTPSKGTVGAVTEVGDGVYTATYTAPLDRSLSFPETVQIDASSANIGKSRSTLITLLPVPTTVTVELGEDSFIADTPEETTVKVTVDQAGPVTAETVTLALSPEVGSVTSPATSNGDGTYSATYTSGGTAGPVTLTATTGAGASEMATITINAGLPANIALDANPTRVTSLGSSTVTATVTDSNGNPAGATLTATTTSGGSVGEFTGTFGTYTATYTAPMVAMGDEGPETITVSTDGASADITLDLTSEPPIRVDTLVLDGTVYKEDGEIIAAGVDVMITVGSMSDTDTTDANGAYGVAFLGFGSTVATTGDTVSVAVTDADGNPASVVMISVNGVAVSGDNFTLLNDILEKVEAGESVTVDVTTDIDIPPRSVDSLTVKGTVFKEDGTTPAGLGLTVEVTVGSMSDTDTTELDGSYSVAFLGFGTPVAATDEIVIVVASDATGPRGTNDDEPIRNIELPVELGGHADIRRNVDTDIGLTSISLTVAGTVYLKNGDTPVPASSDLREGELTVVITNTTRNLTESEPLGDDGTYARAFFNPVVAVAETGDEIIVEVKNEAGKTVGNEPHTLTIADLQTERVEVPVHTTVPAEVRVLHIVGSVIELDDSPAELGLDVTIRLDMHGTILQDVTTTKADGSYSYVFFDLATPIAATGDILTVDVLRQVDQFHAHSGPIYLSSYKLVPTNQPLMVDPITLMSPRLELGGLSINTAYTGIQDPTIRGLLDMDLAGLAAAGADMGDMMGDTPLVALPPSLFLLISPLLSAIGALEIELPMGFDPDDENIAQESFGNAITTRPTAWAIMPADQRRPGRWVNGDQLNLYISGAPTIDSVTFNLNGSPMSATSVPMGGSFTYNFQLEEELIALFVGHMPAFGAVQLMIDGQMPVDMMPSDTGVWSADVALTPGSTVAYYYMITLAKPYRDPLGGLTISSFPLVDPRNRQVMTGALSQAFDTLLSSELGAMNPGVRSVFSVPEVNHQQSLWVGTLDLDADGEYTLDVDVSYRGGYAESITGKTFTVDRMAPTADVALDLNAPGMNAGMYMREDGTYVATGPMPGAASLTVSALPIDNSDPGAFMYQLALLDEAGYPGIWNPAVTAGLLPLDLVKLLTDPGSILPVTYGPSHQIDMLIRNSQGGALLGRYGLRAVGIDSLLNMDSSREVGPVVHLVSPDPDVALVTSVQSDFDGNGVIEGLEMQSTSGDVVVFSDSIVYAHRLRDQERTDHPLVSIVVEFQICRALAWQTDRHATDADHACRRHAGPMIYGQLGQLADYPGLYRIGADRVMLRTVTTNALNVVHPEECILSHTSVVYRLKC